MNHTKPCSVMSVKKTHIAGLVVKIMSVAPIHSKRGCDSLMTNRVAPSVYNKIGKGQKPSVY